MKSKTQGFTLIELLIVIAIIGILAAVLIPNLLSARTRAQTTAGQSYAREVLTGLESLQSTNTKVSYAETVATVEIVKVVSGVGEIQGADLGLTPNNFAFSAAQVKEVLKVPTNGIQVAKYYGNTNTVKQNEIHVQQKINNEDYCTVLNTASNSLATTKGACI